MDSKIIKLEILGIFFIALLGSVLHFTYGWFGNAWWAGLFSAVNESTWEHLKLAVIPATLFALLEFFFLRARIGGFWLAKSVSIFLMPLLIVLFFYSYKAVLGHNLLALDIGIFVLSIAIGQIVSILILKRNASLQRDGIFAVPVLILFSLFILFTFKPLDCFLFDDPLAVLVMEASIAQQDGFYNIDVKYPQIAGAEEFNKSVADLLSGKVEVFKQNAREAWQARIDTSDGEISGNPDFAFDFICEWEKIFESKDQVNFVLDIFYYEGGAHGMNEVHAFNYDLKEEKEIAISDYLKSSQESLDKISTISVMDLVAQIRETGTEADEPVMEWIEEGAAADWNNYKEFNFDENNLIIYFQRYQVAPGAFGSFTVTIPKETLSENSISYLK